LKKLLFVLLVALSEYRGTVSYASEYMLEVAASTLRRLLWAGG
jgi:hypothetical protein